MVFMIRYAIQQVTFKGRYTRDKTQEAVQRRQETGDHEGRRETGDRRQETGDGRWEMGDGRREMGDGRWEMGDGRWEM